MRGSLNGFRYLVLAAAWFGCESVVADPEDAAAMAVPTGIALHGDALPLRELLTVLAELEGINLLLSPDVSGTLSVQVDDVSAQSLMSTILSVSGLVQHREGELVWVGTQEEARRNALWQPLQAEVIPIRHREASTLVELLRGLSHSDAGLLSERGRISADVRQNTVLVSDSAQRVEAVKALLQRLDQSEQQVLIESRIVIAREDFNRQLGARFGVNRLGALDGSSSWALAASLDATGSETAELAQRLNVNLPVSNAVRQALSVLTANHQLDIELSAMESEGQGQVISRPRVVAANQQEAFIQQGVEVPFESVQAGNQTGAVNIEFKQAALELRVRPLILSDERVQLTLAIKQDTVGEIFQTGRGGTVPSIDTRQVSTQVVMAAGQTLVLGGIFQSQHNQVQSGVPGLGGVPFLGRLFSRRGEDDQRRELLVFVTPTILPSTALDLSHDIQYDHEQR